MSEVKPEQMKVEASRTSQQAREEIDQAVQDTTEKGKQMVDEEMVDEVKREASKLAEQQQQNVAQHIEGVAKALTKTADNMQNDQAWIADGARQTAQALCKVSESLRDRDFNTLVRDLENYTRQQPTLVLGGAAIAGFFLTRFLKSSSSRKGDTDQTFSGNESRNDSSARSADISRRIG